MVDCPKCGKTYKNKGAYYQKHVESCQKREKDQKIKERIETSEPTKNSRDIVKRLENVENRLRVLEEKFKKTSNGNSKLQEKQLSDYLPQVSSEEEILKIIKKAILKNTNLYSIKGIIPLEDLKKILNKNYNFTEKQFEDTILRLYRKELIDLQAGGTSGNYHLKSPTGKKFFYLMIKET